MYTKPNQTKPEQKRGGLACAVSEGGRGICKYPNLAFFSSFPTFATDKTGTPDPESIWRGGCHDTR